MSVHLPFGSQVKMIKLIIDVLVIGEHFLSVFYLGWTPVVNDHMYPRIISTPFNENIPWFNSGRSIRSVGQAQLKLVEIIVQFPFGAASSFLAHTSTHLGSIWTRFRESFSTELGKSCWRQEGSFTASVRTFKYVWPICFLPFIVPVIHILLLMRQQSSNDSSEHTD